MHMTQVFSTAHMYLLQMVRAVDTGTFQPKIGFKTRYGLVANPFAEGTTQGLGALNVQANNYYRSFPYC